MGAVDVVPFIPIRGCTMEEAIALSKEVGEEVGARYAVPVFLYEKSASVPYRENLAAIRKGEFEGWQRKSINRSGNLILVRPKDIRQPVRSP